jgi:hypothetical protein
LPTDRNQERQLPECLCKFSSGAQQQREMSRGGAAGVGHVDMGIGAIGNQRVGVFDHFGRHIGVQVEADHERQVLADRLANAGKDFTFAVVEMFCDHRAVQIEIDAVDGAGGLDAVDDGLGDALIGVLCDVGRRACRAPDRRHQLPAFRFRRRHKTGHADIDVAHPLEQPGAVRHRRPAAAPHERVIDRLGRREGVGLVQEAANGDTGHRCCLSEGCARITLDSSLREAQATKQSVFRMASSHFRIAL